MRTGDAGETAVPFSRRSEEEGDDTEAVADHTIAVLVPVIALSPFTSVQVPAGVSFVHEDAVVVVEAKLRVDQFDQVGQNAGMVDQGLERRQCHLQ